MKPIIKLITISIFLGTTPVFGQNSIKLFRFGTIGNEKPAVVLPNGKTLDVSAFKEDYDEKFFTTEGVNRLEKWLVVNAKNCKEVPPNVRIASCVARPSKIVCIGLNYAKHAQESGQKIPREPVIFFKSTTALCGPNDNVIIPKNSEKTDWEVELAIIIGKKASYVSEADALNYVAGYSVINDYSERAFQLERDGGQWDKGKSADSFAPLGPYMVQAKDIADPHNLKIWLKVNGEMTQESNTNDMVYKTAFLVSYISQFMTLLPGDVIATGTPSGVGLGKKPPTFLKEGDIVELGIENLGTQKQKAISFIQSQLTESEYKDFQAWVALGVGGLPNTLEGYRTLKNMEKGMKDPLDVKRFSNDIGKYGDVSVLKNLPKREGTKPNIAPFAIPHRQADQHNSATMRVKQEVVFDAQVADKNYHLTYKTSHFERNSQAICLQDSSSGNPSIVMHSQGEVGHIHPSDGSMHIILSPSDTKEVIEKGWGELHGLAGQGRILVKTYMMMYAPRDEKELAITKQILEAAVKYSRYVPKK